MTRRIAAPPCPVPDRPALLRPALLGTALAMALAALPRPAAAGASPWTKGAGSEARLVGAGPDPDGPGLLAGIEVRLQPHFITYWRDPGDAGVPPRFSFAGSTNLKAATVRYPAPSRLDEAGAVAFGYEGGTLFPILVEPEDPSKPVALAVVFDYAACHDLCLPAHAELRLSVGREPSPEAALVRGALSAVPRPSTVGAAGPAPTVSGVTGPDAAGGFTVRAALPEGGGTLFVEAPDGWAYAAGPAVRDPAAPDGPGRSVFPVKRLDAPGDAGSGTVRPGGPLTLTLVSPGGSVEVPVTLDAAGPKP